MYDGLREKHGSEAHMHISNLLREAKNVHKKDWAQNKTPDGDHEQSWRAFKGKNLEKLIVHIISQEKQWLG